MSDDSGPLVTPDGVGRCAVPRCTGVPSDDKGLCPAHRRALTLTVEIQDSLRKYLNGGHWQDCVRPTVDNARNVVEAGGLLARGIAALISTRFEDVTYDPSPIYAADLAYAAPTPWRVGFSWQTGSLIVDEPHDDEDETEQP